jgi:hypothetical protein
MDISSTAQFPANPDRVYAMMTDSAYLEEVCRATHARASEVSVDGSTTKTSRRLPAPALAAKFTGPELTVVEEISWDQAGSDGGRSGRVKMTVTGQPVTLNGKVSLAPGGPGTVATLTGELKVSIPLVGKKMEEAAAPAVLAGFRAQEKVAASWLAS